MKNLTQKQLKNFKALTINKTRTEYKQVKQALESGNGVIRTGASGQGFKKIWTLEVGAVLTSIGISHTCGNDATRGGACGEFVKITDVRLINKLKKASVEIESLRKAKIERENEISETRKNAIKYEIEMMLTKTDEQWYSDKAEAMKLKGIDKNNAFIEALKSLLVRSGIEKLNFFYETMKAL